MENESHEPPLEPTSVDADDGSILPSYRHDGWTPFARRVFLETLAESGRVSRACRYAGLSVSSAYALRNRDPVFAAGWDAACELLRAPVADTLLEQSLDGVTETVSRNGEVVAERRRFDSRLSIAVLHRLDKRCDLARERGAKHLRLVANWDEYLELVGKGANAEARAMLSGQPTQIAPHLQLPQLPLVENPTESNTDKFLGDIWDDEEGIWWTDYPPPPDFDGLEEGRWGTWGYKRHCSEAEKALLEASRGPSTKLLAATAERDSFFAELAAELGAEGAAEPGESDEAADPGPTRHPDEGLS